MRPKKSPKTRVTEIPIPPKHPANMIPFISPEKLEHLRKREVSREWIGGKFFYPHGRILKS